MDFNLKAFTVFTYAFTILRQFTALYSSIEQVAGRSGGLREVLSLFTRFPETALDRTTIDLCCLSLVVLLLYVHYYVMVNLFMSAPYRHRHFIMDMVIAFGFFANAETLTHIDVQRTFGWSQAWISLVAVCVAMILRLAITHPDSEGKKAVKYFALNWYLICANTATLGWIVGKPRFDSVASMNRIIGVAAAFLALGWLLDCSLKSPKRRIDKALDAWVLALLLLLAGAIARLLLVRPAAETIVQLRHRVPISAVLVAVAAVTWILIPGVTGIDWSRVWRSCVESFGRISKDLKSQSSTQEAKK